MGKEKRKNNVEEMKNTVNKFDNDNQDIKVNKEALGPNTRRQVK